MDEEMNTRLKAFETWRVRQVIDELLSSTTPVGAAKALMGRSGSPSASPFERYAGLVLRDAGAGKLAELPANCTLLLTPPSDAQLARITTTAKLDEAQVKLVRNFEDAINRLCCIADSLEDSAPAGAIGAQRTSISFLGASKRPNQAAYRSALVALPAIGRAEEPDMAYFNEVDWRVLDHVAATAHALFQASVLPNMHQAFMGAFGPDGSDWDVRTRLAAILEKLELPLGFAYRFDVNVDARAVSVMFTVPPASAFPQRTFNANANALESAEGRLDDARAAYAMRLSCLLAAAAFGSGRKIERAYVTGLRDSDLAPVLACAFDRRNYVHRTLTAIDSHELFDPALRFDAAEIARIAAPEHLSFAPFDGDERVEAPAGEMEAQRVAPHLDDRELPLDMQALFHARRVRDIDTRHYLGPGAQAVEHARADAGESVMAAIANLERVAEDLERETAAPDDDADARPLYCANPLSRAVVSLLDDDYAVSAQAEAFLRGDDAAEAPIAHEPRYFRAPDALYHARMGLSDLYERLGDIAGSAAHADRCIALAPTSAAAYFRKADVLASQARYTQAANVLAEGLRVAVSPRDCALLYYHLALILWNTGRKREAVAVHVYTTSLAGEYADKALKVVVNLRKRDDSPVIAYASPYAAAREMARARIPIAPSDAARTLIVKAAVGLSCAGAPEACAPYAAALATYFRDDRIIAAACRSIQYGVKLGTYSNNGVEK